MKNYRFLFTRKEVCEICSAARGVFALSGTFNVIQNVFRQIKSGEVLDPIDQESRKNAHAGIVSLYMRRRVMCAM